MTEEEWLTSDSANRMLTFLSDSRRIDADSRQLRLFACGCCGDFRDLLDDEWRALLDLCELHAGEEDLPRRLDEAKERIVDFYRARTARWGFVYRAIASASGRLQSYVNGSLRVSVNPILSECAEAYRHYKRPVGPRGPEQKQIDLLRCVFGNPFRPSPFDPAWRTTDVRHLALAIHEDRRFCDLPVLADALEDAGCPDTTMLSHCRQDRHHTRGCWVVEQILERG